MPFMKFVKSLALPSEMLPPIIEEESHFDQRRNIQQQTRYVAFLATEFYCLVVFLPLMLYSELNIPRCS